MHWLAPWSRFYNVSLKYVYNIRICHYKAHMRGEDAHHPILRVGPNEVSIMSTEGVRLVWGRGFNRSPWYDVFQNFGKPNMFSSSDKHFHSKRRRIFASAYSKTAVCQPRTYDIIKKCTNKVANFLECATGEVHASMGLSRPIVMRNIFRALQSDVFTAFAFSEQTGTRYLDSLNAGSNSLEELGMADMDLLHDEKRDRVFSWESETPLKYIGRLLGWDGPELHRKAQEWMLRIIRQHESSFRTKFAESNHHEAWKPSDSTVYEKLRTCKDRENGWNLTLDERASEIMDHAVAGQDAVSAALEYMVRQLSKHADVQTELRLELLSSSGFDEEEQSLAMIDSLPYLSAVVMESLRTVDTVSSYQTRVVPKGGCSISGYFLPEGTIVACQPYLINRLPNNFPDPNSFNPSRWLLPEEDHKALSKHLWTYSSGPQSCIGRDFSLAIMKTMLMRIFTRFKTFEDTTSQGSDQMAQIRFQRLPACDRGESSESGSQQSSSIAFISPQDSSLYKSPSHGACRCSARLNSLPPSLEMKRSPMARTEVEDTDPEPQNEADVKLQSRHSSAQGGFSVSPGQLQAGADTPPKHPHSRYTFHKDSSAGRSLPEYNAH